MIEATHLRELGIALRDAAERTTRAQERHEAAFRAENAARDESRAADTAYGKALDNLVTYVTSNGRSH